MIIIIGVSGCGKTTVGKLLSEKTGMPYYDADDFHSQANIKKMKNNISLTDEDRLPWLQTLAKNIKAWQVKQDAILSCSALKEKYRKILSSNIDSILWVYLAGSFDLIKSRIESRNGHYMKSQLLQSQFDDLEVPEYGLNISIDKSPEEIVNIIISKVKQHE